MTIEKNEGAGGASHSDAVLATNEGRLEVKSFNADGVCIEHFIGPSQQELKAAHDAGECDAWCGYCYGEACYALEHSAVANV